MDWKKFLSRKLWVTVFAVVVVAVADLVGVPLEQQTLDSIMYMVLGLLGAQGAVDTAEVWRAGTSVADTIEAVTELAKDDTAEVVKGPAA